MGENQITVRMSGQLLSSIRTKAKALGITPGALIRKTMLEELGTESVPLFKQTEEQEEVGKTQITITLKPSELNAIESRARFYEKSRNSYIISVLRHDAFSRPLLTKRELDALIESTHELNKIGVNLNQIARSINSDRKSGTFTGKQFSEVLHMRDELKTKVNNCIANADRLLNAQHLRTKIVESGHKE